MTPSAIAAELSADLLAGKIRPGEELSQVALAERFGVSRIPIRDALRIVAGDGLIALEGNRSARAITLTPGDIREIYDMRVLLECDCLRRAAACLTPADLQEIERTRRKSDLDAGTPAWRTGDWAFHQAIYQRAARPRQLAVIGSLRRTCQMFIGAYDSLPAKTPQFLAEHRQIVAHLQRGETDLAVSALQVHLESSAGHLLARMAACES